MSTDIAKVVSRYVIDAFASSQRGPIGGISYALLLDGLVAGRNAVRTQLDMGTAGMSPPLRQQVLYLAPLLGAMLMMANSGSICE